MIAFTATAALLPVLSAPAPDVLDDIIERLAVASVEDQFSINSNRTLNGRAERIFGLVVDSLDKSELPKTKKNLRVFVVESSQVNAFACPGGQIYLTTGLLTATGITDGEIAAVIGHELSHVIRGHGRKSIREKVGLSLLISLIDKDSEARIAAEIASQLYTSGRSRVDEAEADRDAWSILQTTNFAETSALAFFRRLEVISERNQGLVEQLFATHDPTEKRAGLFKDWLMTKQFGWNMQLVPTAQASDNQVLAEFANTDPAWKEAYRKSTGWDIYHDPNYFTKNYQGECTWFSFAVRLDSIPLNPSGGNNAHTWLDRCRDSGYAVGMVPKPGAIVVWDKTVGGGAGHVAIVVEVLSDGRLRIWDSNWGKEAGDKNYKNGRVRHRIIRPKNILGYIYWPNGQTEAPPGHPGHVAEAPNRESISLITGPVLLGDEGDGAEMIVTKDFSLSKVEADKTAVIELTIRAIPHKDPIVSINRVEVARIVARSSDWEIYRIPVPMKLLRSGKNVIDIESFVPSLGAGYDDCEVKNVRLKLS